MSATPETPLVASDSASSAQPGLAPTVISGERTAGDAVPVLQRPRPDAEAVGEFARHTHQYQRDYISHAENKAVVIATACFGALAFLETKSALDFAAFDATKIGDWMGIVAAVGFMVAALYAAAVVWPRLGTGKTGDSDATARPSGVIYWNEVRSDAAAEAYAARVAAMGVEELNRQVLEHTHILAGINQQKYRAAHGAIRVLLIAVAFLCAHLVLRTQTPPTSTASALVPPAAVRGASTANVTAPGHPSGATAGAPASGGSGAGTAPIKRP